jgi:hypothetical protein
MFKSAHSRDFRSNSVKFSATRRKTIASLGRSDCVPPPAGVSEVRRGASFLSRVPRLRPLVIFSWSSRIVRVRTAALRLTAADLRAIGCQVHDADFARWADRSDGLTIHCDVQPTSVSHQHNHLSGHVHGLGLIRIEHSVEDRIAIALDRNPHCFFGSEQDMSFPVNPAGRWSWRWRCD